MKKINYLFLTILSFIGISSVKADTYNFDYYYSPSTYYSIEQSVSLLEEKINILINYWEDHYSNEYPYYYIGIDNVVYGEKRLDAYLHYSKNFNSSNQRYYGSSLNTNVNSGDGEEHAIILSIYCNYQSNEQDNCHHNIVNIPSTGSWYFDPIFKNLQPQSEIIARSYDPLAYYTSNFDWYFTKSDTFNVIKDNNTIFSLNYGDIIPTYKESHSTSYTEINLNNYAYVALSLKDYTLRNNNNNQFSTNIFTKGQLCLQPVYNKGMSEKDNISDRCSPVYDDFTPIRVYILKSDLQNNAIYYLKAYNSSIENKVKVDTSVFNITYISNENANNPSVNINGRYYPTIPWNDLSNTVIDNENSGYIPGQSENVTTYFNFSEILSSPLNALRSVWSAITSILLLISTFIALLPATMQGFLYASFALAIVLGIIKIII